MRRHAMIDVMTPDEIAALDAHTHRIVERLSPPQTMFGKGTAYEMSESASPSGKLSVASIRFSRGRGTSDCRFRRGRRLSGLLWTVLLC